MHELPTLGTSLCVALAKKFIELKRVHPTSPIERPVQHDLFYVTSAEPHFKRNPALFTNHPHRQTDPSPNVSSTQLPLSNATDNTLEHADTFDRADGREQAVQSPAIRQASRVTLFRNNPSPVVSLTQPDHNFGHSMLRNSSKPNHPHSLFNNSPFTSEALRSDENNSSSFGSNHAYRVPTPVTLSFNAVFFSPDNGTTTPTATFLFRSSHTNIQTSTRRRTVCQSFICNRSSPVLHNASECHSTGKILRQPRPKAP